MRMRILARRPYKSTYPVQQTSLETILNGSAELRSGNTMVLAVTLTKTVLQLLAEGNIDSGTDLVL
jgi:hypothetical protein